MIIYKYILGSAENNHARFKREWLLFVQRAKTCWTPKVKGKKVFNVNRRACLGGRPLTKKKNKKERVVYAKEVVRG